MTRWFRVCCNTFVRDLNIAKTLLKYHWQVRTNQYDGQNPNIPCKSDQKVKNISDRINTNPSVYYCYLYITESIDSGSINGWLLS